MQNKRREQIKKSGRFSISSTSAKTLLSVNFIPLVGVMFFEWSLFSIMLLYWLENIVIGFYNVLKMLRADGISAEGLKIGGKQVKSVAKLGFVIFFVFHFGIFALVHGVFVFTIFGITSLSGTSLVNQGTIPWSEIAWPDVSFLGILFALLMLIVSHGISYRKNYIQNGEYKKVSAAQQLFKPYGRVISMHFIILISAFVIAGLGYSVFTATILIAIKTVIDLFTHNREHTKMSMSDMTY
ncbi:hypothetical protein KKB10_00365 [Patescibacteria group bacterium]|nr:hypothetical protein [Patescibacteria group bacterium]MBU1075184.1 hypothetical protein [Patescibacteria group bacterium]MBU1951978.1 hypothetical protein [Patescibacteria group bacterium]